MVDLQYNYNRSGGSGSITCGLGVAVRPECVRVAVDLQYLIILGGTNSCKAKHWDAVMDMRKSQECNLQL